MILNFIQFLLQWYFTIRTSNYFKESENLIDYSFVWKFVSTAPQLTSLIKAISTNQWADIEELECNILVLGDVSNDHGFAEQLTKYRPKFRNHIYNRMECLLKHDEDIFRYASIYWCESYFSKVLF